MAIQKTIHYIWVGGTPKPLVVQKCIDSWSKVLPEYELKLWDESNFPDMQHPYVQAMYKQKKWAFVSDYIRFWVLYKYGGIYLDTDMEVLKPLSEFLDNEVFMGRVSSGHLACGIIGAESGSIYIKRILEFYDTDTEFSIKNTSPKVAQRALQDHDNVRVYNSEVFYPCDDGVECNANVLAQAYTNHHWAESWVRCARLRKALRRVGIMPLIKSILNKHD